MDVTITAELVAHLVGTQFPQWAHLPVTPVDLDGWDNATFRLGDELSVRLPRRRWYVAQVDKEHRWLPFLAAHLPVPIPEPVAKGAPAAGYPWPWSVYRWIEGDPVATATPPDPILLANDLADFLGALHAVDAVGGPPPGDHNFQRGGPLVTYDVETREVIGSLAGEVDAAACGEAWEAALASTWNREPVWVHGDLAGSNVLIRHGRLSGVIDFGCTAVGDPACDLTMSWTSFVADSRAAFRQGLSLDDATWARGRGWALWKALITLAGSRVDGTDPDDPAQRFGWRLGPRQVIDEVLADHRLEQARAPSRDRAQGIPEAPYLE